MLTNINKKSMSQLMHELIGPYCNVVDDFLHVFTAIFSMSGIQGSRCSGVQKSSIQTALFAFSIGTDGKILLKWILMYVNIKLNHQIWLCFALMAYRANISIFFFRIPTHSFEYNLTHAHIHRPSFIDLCIYSFIYLF